MKEKKDFKVLLLYPNLSFMKIPPLALGLFTSILKAEGYCVEMFDATCYKRMSKSSHEDRRTSALQYRKMDSSLINWEVKDDLHGDFKKCLLRFKPDIIFVSVVEDTFYNAIEMLPVARKLGIPTVIGGVFTTAAPAEALSYDCVEMVAVGEGESLVVEVSERLRTGVSLDGTPNLWVKKSDGSIVKGQYSPLANIDKAVPDYTIFHPDRFLRPWGGKVFKTVTVECMRGCPYDCTFCNSPLSNRLAKANGYRTFVRRKSLSCVQRELRWLKESVNPEFIMFIDDTFLTRPQQELKNWCEMYSEFKIPFWVNTRLESITKENLSDLKSVGCHRMSFSIEHGNEKFRKEILKKHFTNEAAIRAGGIVAESGIPFSVDSIIGLPYETRELLFDTVEINRQIPGYDALTINIFTPYHGTELRNLALKEGWMDANALPSGITGASMLKMPEPYLQQQDIEGLFRTFILYAGMPRERWGEIEQAESFTDEGNDIFHRLANEYYEKKFGAESSTFKVNDVSRGSGCRTSERDSI